MQDTYNYLKKLLACGDKVVIACSSGPDSMFLLELLLYLQKTIKFDLIVAHVNHNLRKESEEEYLYIKNYCNERKLTFEYYKIDAYDNGNIEAQAREKRYVFLKDVVKKYNAKYLMTAHHGDDLVETILMRLTRGSNLNGYIGFKVSSDMVDYKVIRPLIFMTKDEINKYLNENRIKYYIDQTNESSEYTRNRYRKNILPFLKEENNDVHLKYLSFSQELEECVNYIDSIVENIVQKYFKDNVLYIDNILDEDEFIIKKVCERILKIIYQDDIYLINKNHLNNLMELIHSKFNYAIDLPNKIKFVKEYTQVKVVKDLETIKDYNYIFDKHIDLLNGYEIIQIEQSDNHNNFHLYLNSKELTLPLIVRTRNNGDKMAVKNLNGHKKVKDILIDEKIPISQRKEIPIVTDSDNNILWIPGVKKSKFDKENIQNYDIILKYQKKEGEFNE